MPDTDRMVRKIEDTLPMVFGRAEFSTQPVVPGTNTVVRKVRATQGVDPTSGETWMAVEEKRSRLLEGRYIPEHTVNFRRIVGDFLSVHVNLDEQNVVAFCHDEYVDPVKAQGDISRGWITLKLFSNPVQLEWGESPWGHAEA